MPPRHSLANFAFMTLDQAALAAIEKRTQEIGVDLFSRLKREKPRIWQRRWWDDRIMDWSMSDEKLKVELFRFVDVLPMLQDSDSVANHLVSHLRRAWDKIPFWMKWALNVGHKFGWSRAIMSKVAKTGAADFAKRFIAGSNTAEVLAASKAHREKQLAFTLDILGEAVTSHREANRYFEGYLELIEKVAPTVNTWPSIASIDLADFGELSRMNLSIKLSALDCHFDAIDPEGVTRRVGARFRELLRLAKKQKAFINVDMESYEKKDLTIAIFQKVLAEPEFADMTEVGIVLQCYLRDSGEDFIKMRDWAQKRGAPVWIRLVKGAYWDHETILAKANDWPIPVYQQKWESDANYEAQTRFIMENIKWLRPAFGSHNLRSISHAIATAEHLGLPKNAYEFQALYGMADAEKAALVQQGHRVRVYMPYGELIPGMAYLVRRLLENTSNDSFLRASVSKGVNMQRLLAAPAPAHSA